MMTLTWLCPLFEADVRVFNFDRRPPFVGACLNVRTKGEITCAKKLNHKEIPMTFTAKHISVSINCPAVEVYEFAANPENLPKWAAGLSGSIRKVDENWIAEPRWGR
jgi:uncharacterized membrane protein